MKEQKNKARIKQDTVVASQLGTPTPGTAMQWQRCVVVDACIDTISMHASIQYRMWRSPAEERLEVSAHGAGEAVMIHGPMGR